MHPYSTSEAARMLGITQAALSKYIKAGKVPMPKKVRIGRLTIHSWTKNDVEELRKLLPKIANGRKTRHTRKQLAISNQQLAKSETKAKKKPQPGAAVPHDFSHTKKPPKKKAVSRKRK